MEIKKLLNEIKEYGESHNIPISMEETLSFLCDTIKKENCQKVLEIGTAIAYASIAFASVPCVKIVDTVELDFERYNLALKNIASSGLGGKINCFHMDALEFLKNNKNLYDLIYLDGPKGQYITYLPYLLSSLNEGGILIADNLFFHGMVTGKTPVGKGCRAMIKGLKQYIAAVTSDPLTTEILPIGDGLGITKKIKK